MHADVREESPAHPLLALYRLQGTPSIQGDNQPYWWNLDASNIIFNTARARAYLGKVDINTSSATSALEQPDGEDAEELEAAGGPSSRSYNPKWLPPGITPVLEEQPKWHLLREVLDEIEQELALTEAKDISPNNTILIMASGQRSCRQVRWFLSTMGKLNVGQESNREEDAENGGREFVPGRKMMRSKLKRHFEHKAAVGRLNASLKQQAGTNASASSSTKAPAPFSRTGSSTVGPMSDALKRKEVWERGAAPPNKRRRQRGGGMVGSSGSTARPNETPSDAIEGEAADVAGFYDRAMAVIAKEEGEEGDDDDDTEGPGAAIGGGPEEDGEGDGDDNEISFMGETRADLDDGDTATFTQVDFDNYFGVLDMDS